MIKEQLVLEDKAQQSAAMATAKGGLSGFLDGLRQAQRLVHAAVSGDSSNLGSIPTIPLNPTTSLEGIGEFGLMRSLNNSFSEPLPRIVAPQPPKRREVFLEVRHGI